MGRVNYVASLPILIRLPSLSHTQLRMPLAGPERFHCALTTWVLRGQILG